MPRGWHGQRFHEPVAYQDVFRPSAADCQASGLAGRRFERGLKWFAPTQGPEWALLSRIRCDDSWASGTPGAPGTICPITNSNPTIQLQLQSQSSPTSQTIHMYKELISLFASSYKDPMSELDTNRVVSSAKDNIFELHVL